MIYEYALVAEKIAEIFIYTFGQIFWSYLLKNEVGSE